MSTNKKSLGLELFLCTWLSRAGRHTKNITFYNVFLLSDGLSKKNLNRDIYFSYAPTIWGGLLYSYMYATLTRAHQLTYTATTNHQLSLTLLTVKTYLAIHDISLTLIYSFRRYLGVSYLTASKRPKVFNSEHLKKNEKNLKWLC